MTVGNYVRLLFSSGPAAAHRHRGRSLRRPPHQWGRVYDRWLGASTRCPARPRRPPAPRQVPPAPSTPAVPGMLACGSKPGQAPPPPIGTAAGPSGTLHTGGACWVRRLGARSGPAATHRHCGQASPQPHRCRVKTSLTALLSPHPISHVIPPWLFQMLNLDRWNSNVSELY